MPHVFYVSIRGPREGVKTGSAMLDQLITFTFVISVVFKVYVRLYMFTLCAWVSEVLAGHKCEHTIFFKYDRPVQAQAAQAHVT